ncbi:MAG: glutamyl-tRNA reductase, partial [Spirochaetota bacterium]
MSRMTDIVLIGTNYRTSAVERRECFSVKDGDLHALYGRLREKGIGEAVYISTCNRAELYIADEDAQSAAQKGISFFKETADISDEELYVKYPADAASHLFAVTASLDSMVLGETEIANQIKNGYSAATAHGMTGPFTHKLFHAAFRCSKRVRSETGIARNPVSVATIAGELAKKHFPDIPCRSALLIGAGEMGELVLKTLDKCGIGEVTVANRSVSRAESIATGLSTPVKTVPLNQIADAGNGADIIICSITADSYIVTPELIRSLRTTEKPVVIIDIGIPR